LKTNVTRVLHLNLDDGWEVGVLGLPTVDLRVWGPKLRFSAPTRVIESFFQAVAAQLAPFLVYGSGDFHHLSALWLRRLDSLTTLVSFDNHPDWDVRPPRWACGGWINRALELPQIEKVSVWGCGNFECWWPMRLFGNNLAELKERLEVHPWADGRSVKDQRRRGAILRGNWQEKFSEFVGQLGARRVYVTIDLDCLSSEEAITNWESGRFHLEDLVWALDLLGQNNRIVAGDICGAWSPASYARRKQRFVSEMDHPKLTPRDPLVVRQTNQAALERLLPHLTHRDQNDPKTDND
jgi:hypothetical protein